jgi:hypothetical protein
MCNVLAGFNAHLVIVTRIIREYELPILPTSVEQLIIEATFEYCEKQHIAVSNCVVYMLTKSW